MMDLNFESIPVIFISLTFRVVATKENRTWVTSSTREEEEWERADNLIHADNLISRTVLALLVDDLRADRKS